MALGQGNYYKFANRPTRENAIRKKQKRSRKPENCKPVDRGTHLLDVKSSHPTFLSLLLNSIPFYTLFYYDLELL